MKDDKHKSVILYAEWKKPLQNLSLEQKGRILDALLDFPDGIIRQALKNDSIPVFILYTVYHLLHDYMPH